MINNDLHRPCNRFYFWRKGYNYEPDREDSKGRESTKELLLEGAHFLYPIQPGYSGSTSSALLLTHLALDFLHSVKITSIMRVWEPR